MVVEDNLQGIEHVGSDIVAAVEIAETVIASVVGVEAEAQTVFATAVVVEAAVNVDDVEAVNVDDVEADIVMVGVHYVVEGYIGGVDSAAVIEVVQIEVVGYVDDASLARIDNVHAIVEVRAGLWVGIGIDTSVVEAEFEPKELRVDVRVGLWVGIGIDTSVVEVEFETLT
jgi:hypothetical protein